ncbi:hypothetical protein Kpol_1043p5 [Vanderwaltozyma polyspora DSM 70294]|uniref:Uncharacterized protein n=1 Tax=Vanderwaltozyma polyspora (strain ATCC 22028 / DSM 70294 / BCRC 21397 / CBS 2163 / NBRC 10782 / NRRL Y-8283 / UCD 57-17) TaxID=436907 RepID=A7TIM3_VANPO|nr:uncharacterized protein Kpol_1043p5 [Vanderwaltozyma polyspora DSM 70294]EDO17815.1 hypothetical protein Kpol_1043p5 [Vanderwaltozyma polyspora DSM 70294]
MLIKSVYNTVNRIYETFGSGKTFEAGVDTVLILGGSSNKFGLEVCKTFVLNYNSKVINIDTNDISYLLTMQEAFVKNYTFVECSSLSNRDKLLESLKFIKDNEINVTVFINNLQEGLESLYSTDYEELLSVEERIEHLERCVTINLTNVMIATKYYLTEIIPQIQQRLENPSFYIINMSCEQPDGSLLYASHYLCSKMALNQFHDGLSSELSQRGKTSIEKSQLPKIKMLLIFLPHIVDYNNWKNLCPAFAKEFVKCIEDGRRGFHVLPRDVYTKRKR